MSLSLEIGRSDLDHVHLARNAVLLLPFNSHIDLGNTNFRISAWVTIGFRVAGLD
jgi:hypothetical protein